MRVCGEVVVLLEQCSRKRRLRTIRYLDGCGRVWCAIDTSIILGAEFGLGAHQEIVGIGELSRNRHGFGVEGGLVGELLCLDLEITQEAPCCTRGVTSNTAEHVPPPCGRAHLDL